MFDYAIDYPFTTYETVVPEKVLIELPILKDPVDLDWASRVITDDNGNVTPIAKDTMLYREESPLIAGLTKPSLTKYSISEEDKNLSFEEIAKQENLPIRIASSFRKGAMTKSGHRSYHSQKDAKGNPKAYDIVPLDGNFDNLLNLIYSNPRLVNWFKANNYGILEETTSTVKAKTGATGNHLHIGPDTWARLMFENRLKGIKKALQGMKFEDNNFTTYELVEPNKVELNLPIKPVDISDWAVGVTPSGIPIAKNQFENNNLYREEKPLSVSDNTPVETESQNESKTESTMKSEDNRVKTIYNFFANKGMKDNHIRGIIGSLYGESGLDPQAVNSSSGALGLALWLGPRKAKLIDKYGKNPTFELQLEFLWDELQSTENRAYKALLETNTVYDATKVFMQKFERPSQKEMLKSFNKRLNFANSV